MFNRLFNPDGKGTIIRNYVLSPAMKSRVQRQVLILTTVGMVLAACGREPELQTVVDLTCGSQQTELTMRKTSEFRTYRGRNPRLVKAKNKVVTFFKGKQDYGTLIDFRQAMLDSRNKTVDEAFIEMCRKMNYDNSFNYEDREFNDDGGGSYGG